MGLKPILRNTTSFSALTLLVGSFDPQNRPEMTYNVFSGTLNPTHFTSTSLVYDCKVYTVKAERIALLFPRQSFMYMKQLSTANRTNRRSDSL